MIYKILDKASGAATKGASIVIIFVVLFTLANILLRSIFNAPLSGAVELVCVGMLVANALALGRAGLLDRHIAVPQFVDWLPARAGSCFRFVTSLLGMATFAYVTITYFLAIPAMMHTHRVTDVLKVPTWSIYLVMAICFLFATLMFLYWTVIHFKRIIHPVKEKKVIESVEDIDARDMLV